MEKQLSVQRTLFRVVSLGVLSFSFHKEPEGRKKILLHCVVTKLAFPSMATKGGAAIPSGSHGCLYCSSLPHIKETCKIPQISHMVHRSSLFAVVEGRHEPPCPAYWLVSQEHLVSASWPLCQQGADGPVG